MKTYKYTDDTNRVVHVIDKDGVSRMSMLASAVPEGAAILPFFSGVEHITEQVVAATQKRLDDFARTRNYDGILSACTYATSAVPKFAAEGQYCATARDATWAALYAFMGQVQSGECAMPSSFEDVAPELPALEWPQ